ncbi:MAG: NAD kinase [Bacteroidetes bacterium]|jgi:NAD+ kinase|nr:NAD kinase [Bacteroidota bacterium]
MKVGVYARHSVNPNHSEYIRKFFDYLNGQKVEILVHQQLVGKLDELNYKHTFDVFGSTLKKDQVDVLVSLGGDGTVLDTLSIVKATETPVLGINLGRFGFLANSRQEEFAQNFAALKTGDYSIEKRLVIELVSKEQLFDGFPFGLNDIVVQKKDTSNMITVHTKINNEPLNSYWSDGLIVATPTGSTGYSLSCGGPILYPGTSSFVLTAIAPHNLSVRPLVIGDHKELTFEVDGRGDDFLVTIDSRSESIPKGSILKVKRANFDFHMIRLNEQSYAKTLRNKLLWGIDKRN